MIIQVDKWWQALRTALAFTFSVMVMFIYAERVASINYDNGYKQGVRAGYVQGLQTCPKFDTTQQN